MLTREKITISTQVQKGRWSKEEDAILTASVKTYLNKNPKSQQESMSWSKIAQMIPNRTGIQCQARWTEALDPSVRKGRWKKDEDEKLQAAVKKFGCCWIRVAESIPGRTQRQSRTRWKQIQSKVHKVKTCKEKKKKQKKLKGHDDVGHKSSFSQKQAIETLSAAPIRLAVPYQTPYIIITQNAINSITIPHYISSPLASPTSTLLSFKEDDDHFCNSPVSSSSCGDTIQQKTPTSLTAIDATRILDDLDLSYSSFIHNNDTIPPTFSNNIMKQHDFRSAYRDASSCHQIPTSSEGFFAINQSRT